MALVDVRMAYFYAAARRTEFVELPPEKGCIKGEHIVANVHGDDITIGGKRSAVGLLIKLI